MRPFALTLALLASAQLVVATTPAWAEDPPRPPSTPADGTVQVHVETVEKVSLEHRSAPNAPWEFACSAPCDTRLPVADDYRVTGARVNESRVFNLQATGDRVNLRVVGGDKTKENVGMWVVIGGGALIVAGILTMAIGAHPGRTFTADDTTNNTNYDVLTAGTILCLGGVAGGLFGGAWWFNNRHAHVGGDVLGAPPARGSLPALEQTGMRTPAPVAPVFQLPVFSAKF